MNISLLQENLLRSLTRINRIISTKTQLPVLQNVLLTTEDGRLRMTATNTETTESVWMGGKIEKEGSFCVPSRVFTELVATLPQDTVHLSVKGGSLFVSCAGTEASLPGVPSEEFPDARPAPEGKGTSILKEELVNALRMVIFAAATDDSRPLLSGVRFEKKDGGGGLSIAATDGYRLSLVEPPISLKGTLGAVIPARALGEVVKVCMEEKEGKDLTLREGADGQMVFTIGDTQIVTRAIDGEFPSIEKIIPKSYTTRAKIEKEALLRAVKSAAIFARDNANIVRFSVHGQSLSVSASTSLVGENRVDIDADVDGEGGEIAFNSRFLLEFLSNYPEEDLLFEMTGALNPGVFRPVRNSSFFHIIMPVRTAVPS